MKEKVIEKFMEKIMSYLGSAEAFFGEQIPSYIKELLHYEFTRVVVWLVFTIVLLIVLFFTFKWICSFCEWSKDIDYGDMPKEFAILVCAVIWFLVSTIAINQALDIVKIKTAPRVYLLEYVRGVK